MASAFLLLRGCECVLRRPCRKFLKYTQASYVTTREELLRVYTETKKSVAEATPKEDVNPEAIYANNEMSLADIEVYGFDYDYTLATYTPALHKLIFDLGKQALVSKLKYPAGILNFQYDEHFAVRGLHFDTMKGLVMKIDSFHNIQLGTVYRGIQPVSDEEVISLYSGTHVSLDYMNTFYGAGPMHQMIDLFAIPEITLISLVTEYFIQNNMIYDPEYVFYDIRNAVQDVHTTGLLHHKIMSDLDAYLQKGQETKVLLERLVSAGKNLFLITNSGFPFIDAGMRYMVGPDWMNLFDIIITNARKPKFFHAGSRPFRLYNPELETHSWGRVTSLEKGKVYQQGNVHRLRQMTGWFGPRVLYFGDHVYSDLADPSLRYGWRTGAIIPELEREIELQNKPEYKAAVRWLVALQHLIREMQHQNSTDSKQIIYDWVGERDELRKFTKAMFNPNFGSLFRTYHNPTYFFRRLARFADIYTSSLTNILNYPDDYTFYPHRVILPHEPGLEP
ncbi:5'-nucleotidase domain-containing protein 2-like [Pomacea canaliculata]|uniref:5'-nucleotidase domain-containing protein 2-like n=1 Tax=Pomacea canaliculata TaxID=400727 RepID=UPI000D72756D|nr:5'-nucleotidase domain-containing protein 2-like [Pomacea canaliculata]